MKQIRICPKPNLKRLPQTLLEVHRLAEAKRAEGVSEPETAVKSAGTEKPAEVKKVDNSSEAVLVKEALDKDGKKNSVVKRSRRS